MLTNAEKEKYQKIINEIKEIRKELEKINNKNT